MIYNQSVSFKMAGTAEKMLVKLTQVTQDNLQDVKGSLRALWATAQQINARQKVELSIRCVFSTINKHWNYDTQVRFVSEGLKSKFDPYYLNL